MKYITNFFFLTLISIFVIACNQKEETKQENRSETNSSTQLKGQSGVVDSESEPHILNIAIGSPDHTTLVAAVQAAGLEDVLTNAGPLTVFAPTNEAFDKLPEGTVETLLKPENKETLANIITFHAAPGSYTGNRIKGVMGIGQATGDKVKVEVKDGVTFVNGAKVLGTVKASNGYVHVIDQVLLPPEEK
ncbi:MAG: fasciclin domain-containing protein [Saprospiraceae bacterium]|nr:fasciclin domain-containing protein [Saprospiraceae bacterium]